MPKITELKPAEAKKEHEKSAQKGQWKELIERVKNEHNSFKVEDITRGQIAALYRTAKGEGLRVKTSYKNGYIVLSPPE